MVARSNWRQKMRGKDVRVLSCIIYCFRPFSIYYIPHNYVIPQAMPHAIPQTRPVCYPHRCIRQLCPTLFLGVLGWVNPELYRELWRHREIIFPRLRAAELYPCIEQLEPSYVIKCFPVFFYMMSKRSGTNISSYTQLKTFLWKLSNTLFLTKNKFYLSFKCNPVLDLVVLGPVYMEIGDPR